MFFNLNLHNRSAGTGRCGPTCPRFFFASNQQCQACPLPCSQCRSTSVCVDCSPISSNDRKVLYQGSCIMPAACPSGYFVRNGSQSITYIDNGNALTGS